MAITFQKQPLNFFNVNEAAIFEFTSDEDLGVNQNDLVADLEIKSLWTGRKYIIKNILPNYGTGVFRVNVQGYLKSLMLDNFNYRFESPNKRYSIENFSIGVSVHAENVGGLGDSFYFDSGYIFDEGFIFADNVPSDNNSITGFFPMLGLSHISEMIKPQKDVTKLNLLAPKYVEYAEGFGQTISAFVPSDQKNTLVFVDGVSSVVPSEKGVQVAPINDAQVRKMYLPTLITTSLNNDDIEVYGISYKPEDCEETLQFRFYTSYAGYSYFYTRKQQLTAGRGKSDFINNDFYNQQDGRSSEVQRSSEYSESVQLSGTKAIELEELIRELLRSPKIEVMLHRGYTECKVTGSLNVRKLDLEYTLNVDLANSNQMTL